MSEDEKAVLPTEIWCLVANVAEEQIYGENHEVRRGTKHFSANTKVYCFPGQWGDGYERIKVIAHHRGSPKLITMVMPSRRLTNWRVKLVYKPYIIREMGEGWDKESAQRLVPWLQFREKIEQAKILGFDTVEPNDALLYATYLGRIEEIHRALERGADINVRGLEEMTPLMLAFQIHRNEVAFALLDLGANAEISTSAGKTALKIALDEAFLSSIQKEKLLALLGYEDKNAKG